MSKPKSTSRTENTRGAECKYSNDFFLIDKKGTFRFQELKKKLKD